MINCETPFAKVHDPGRGSARSGGNKEQPDRTTLWPRSEGADVGKNVSQFRPCECNLRHFGMRQDDASRKIFRCCLGPPGNRCKARNIRPPYLAAAGVRRMAIRAETLREQVSPLRIAIRLRGRSGLKRQRDRHGTQREEQNPRRARPQGPGCRTVALRKIERCVYWRSQHADSRRSY